MGYTHWWKFNIPIVSAEAFEAIAADVSALRDAAYESRGVRTEFDLDAEAREFVLNGVEGEYADDLVFRAGPVLEGDRFSRDANKFFCKTARRPYDIVVAATWIALKHHFGDDIVLDSDGRLEEPEWSAAFELYHSVFPDRPAPVDFLVHPDVFWGFA